MEILLLASLGLPLLVPSGLGLDTLLGSLLAPLPAVAGTADGADPEVARLRRQNRALRLELADLRSRFLAVADAAKLRAADKAYYDRNPIRIEAPVLGRDPFPWRGSLLVEAGEREGLAPGQAVVFGRALVGVVSEVGPLVSRVRLVADPGVRVWAEVVSEGGARGEGVLVGSGVEDEIEMRLVPADRGAVGDPVFTATGKDEIPRGLYVGDVSEFADIDRSGVAEVTVRPAVRPEELRFVNVLATGRR